MAALNYWLWLTTRKGVGQRGVLRVLPTSYVSLR